MNTSRKKVKYRGFLKAERFKLPLWRNELVREIDSGMPNSAMKYVLRQY